MFTKWESRQRLWIVLGCVIVAATAKLAYTTTDDDCPDKCLIAYVKAPGKITPCRPNATAWIEACCGVRSFRLNLISKPKGIVTNLDDPNIIQTVFRASVDTAATEHENGTIVVEAVVIEYQEPFYCDPVLQYCCPENGCPCPTKFSIPVEGFDESAPGTEGTSCSAAGNACYGEADLGKGDFRIGSGGLEVSIALGKGWSGAAGELYMFAKTPSPSLILADSLMVTHTNGFAVSVNGDERTITTPSGRAVITQQWVGDDPAGFTVAVYAGNAQTAFETFAFSDSNDNDGLTVLKTGPDLATMTYDYIPTTGGWQFETWQGEPATGSRVRTDLREYTSATTEQHQITDYTASPGGSVIYHSLTTYGTGTKLVQVYTGADTTCQQAATTLNTSYEYDSTGTNPRLRFVQYPDGGWVWYKEFDDQGRVTKEVRPWKTSTRTQCEANEALGHVFEYDYTEPNGTAFDPDMPRMITERVGGQVVSKKYFSYYLNSGTSRVAVEEIDAYPSEDNHRGAAANQITTKGYYPDPGHREPPSPGYYPSPNEDGRIWTVSYPDGRQDYYTYDRGTYTASAGQPGTFASGQTLNAYSLIWQTGADLKTTISHYVNVNGQSWYDYTEETIQNAAGLTVERRTSVRGQVNAWREWTVSAYDARGHLTDEYYLNGTSRHLEWGDCCLDQETDPTGIVTHYSVSEALGVPLSKTKTGAEINPGAGTMPDKTWTYSYDGLRRKIGETVSFTGYIQGLSTSTSYYVDGRVKSTTDEAGLITQYCYADNPAAGSGRTVTVTRPGGATEITEYYPDGQVKSVTGTGVVARHYDYGYDVTYDSQNNPIVTRWTREEGPSSQVQVEGQQDPVPVAMYTKTGTDVFGRTVAVEKPAFNDPLNANPQVSTSEYYAYGETGGGRLKKSTSPEAPATSYTYDTFGNVTQTAVDVDGNGIIDYGADRVTDSYTYWWNDSGWWQITENTVYTDSNLILTKNMQWLAPPAWGSGDGTTAQSISFDPFNLKTTRTSRVIAQQVGETTVYHTENTVAYPDGASEVSTSKNGLLASRTSRSGLTTRYGYDGFERQTTVTDSRGITTTTGYYPMAQGRTGQTGLPGKLARVTDAAGYYTSYGYDATTGRLASTINPGGKAEYQSYTVRGELEHVWGDAPYPVEYIYDDCGRKTEMHTYRAGTAWNNAAGWPTGTTGTADVTKWAFDPGTGLVTKKTGGYGATGVDPIVLEYSYTPAGKLASRTGGRGRVTNYVYDPNTGVLTDVQYRINGQPDPDTHDLSFTRDRFGRLGTVTDAVGTRIFAYRDDLDMQLLTETIEAGTDGLYSELITRTYDETPGDGTGNGTTGRYTGFEIWTDGQTTADYTSTYGYDAAGRINKITGPGLPQTDGVSYERLKNAQGQETSELIAKTKFGTGTTPPAQIVRTFETVRDVLLTVTNNCSGSLVSGFNYGTGVADRGADSMRRRSRVTYSGSAFVTGTTSPPGFVDWLYNDRDELTSARRYQTSSGEIYASGRVYLYDSIGNRSQENPRGATYPMVSYTRNALNQYATRSDSGGMGPPPAETFGYDLDGNMTSTYRASYTYTDGNGQQQTVPADGVTYTWDAENRLISATPVALVNGSSKRTEFKYDYMGRRVEKKVWTYTNGAWPADPGTVERYVYDGWNVVLTLNALSSPNPNAIIRKSTWGLDLSGTLQGAGGIGGLLANKEGSNSYWYFYDGNGNVTEVIAPPSGTVVQNSLLGGESDLEMNAVPADGESTYGVLENGLAAEGMMAAGAGGPGGPGGGCTVLAHYEYDPYGNIIYSSGTYASPFRFSTKWIDTQLGSGKELYYFGYRYYSPRLGRWLSRDPIGERGGSMLYRFVGNNPPNKFDPLGLYKWKDSSHWGFDIWNPGPSKWHHDEMKYTIEMDWWCQMPGSLAGFNPVTVKEFDKVKEIDDMSWSYGWYTVGSKDSVEVNQSWVAGKCEPDEGGSKQLGEVEVIWKQEAVFGVEPGIGPISVDIGLAATFSGTAASKKYSIVIDCCCKKSRGPKAPRGKIGADKLGSWIDLSKGFYERVNPDHDGWPTKDQNQDTGPVAEPH